MLAPTLPRFKSAERAAQPPVARETTHARTAVETLNANERAKLLPVLDAATRRAQEGNYTFTDRAEVGTWERLGQPDAYGRHTPGLEAQHHDAVDAARKVASRHGQGEQFDAVMAVAQKQFLERRRSEVAEVRGDTVSEILDWMSAEPDAAYLSAQVAKASQWLKSQRLAEIAKKPFFQRMSARIGRVRSYLGNDHGTEDIDVVAGVVAALNKQGARETLTGAEFVAALRNTYPDAFASAGVPASAVQQRAELN